MFPPRQIVWPCRPQVPCINCASACRSVPGRRADAGSAAGLRRPSHVDGQLVSMSIVDREAGQAMTTYRKDGRTFVAGRPAARYAIRLANQTGRRVMVVLSVDGVNVITGETASVGQSGYVLDPWQSYDIREAPPRPRTPARASLSAGILPHRRIAELIASKQVAALRSIEEAPLQPAGLDLRLRR